MGSSVWGLIVMLTVHTVVLGVPLDGEQGLWLRLLSKLSEDCSKKDSAIACLKGKAITFFDRASKSESISIGDSVVLVKEEDTRVDYGRTMTDHDLESVVQDSDQSKLNDLLFDRFARFLSSHTVKLSLPRVTSHDLARGYQEGNNITHFIRKTC